MDLGELSVDFNQNNLKLTTVVDKNDCRTDVKDQQKASIIKKPRLDISNCSEDSIEVEKVCSFNFTLKISLCVCLSV